MTDEEQKEHRDLIDYLMQQDFSQGVSLIELASLNFDLTEQEDNTFLKKSRHTILKLLKVILYYMGLLQKKLEYRDDNIEKRTNEQLQDHKDVTNQLFNHIKDSQNECMFSMADYNLKIDAANKNI